MDANLFLQNEGLRTIANPNYNSKSKKNKEPRTLDIIDLSADRNQLQNIVAQDLLNQERVSTKEARKYEKYGINWNAKEAANGSLDVQLADAQSNWAKLGNALAQTVVSEIGLGTMLGISDLFDAIGQAIGKSDHDYNNPVSAKLEEWQDKFNNEVAPIYSRPGSGFGNGTDFGWWMQNIPSIASSLTLLIPAAGATKALSLIGKGIAKGTKAATKWAARAARLERIQKAGHAIPLSSRAIETGKLFAKNATTAALSRTMENYQEARQVYNDMYVDVLDSLNNMNDEDYNSFISRNPNTFKDVDTSNKDEVAKAVARKSSDMTFKADYANTVFDIIQLYALRNVAFHGFRNSKVSAAARRLDKNARRFAGKYNTIAELEEQVSKQSLGRKITDKLGDFLYAGRTVIAAQASEGVEEAVNYIAQQEGMNVGKTMVAMEANSVFSNRLNQYIKNPELWESAFWGVAGGIVFQGAGSGLARARTALERKNEKKKNQPNEKTGESVNESVKGYNTKRQLETNAKNHWKDLWELPDVKRVKTSIENRLAIENDYQQKVKEINDDNEMANEEKELLLQHLREQRRTNLALNAMDSGTIDMLKGYLEDDNVKQALIDKGVVSKEQADELQKEDIEAIQKVQDLYDSNVKKLNAISRNINAKNETNIPTEYLQIIARNNIEAQLSIENLEKTLASWTNESNELYQDLAENDKLDKNINYKEAIRLRWLSEKLGQLEADKKEILNNKKLAKSISGQERLRELNDEINIVRNQVVELNPDNKLENLLFAIESSLSYEKQGGYYLETGRNKDYVEFITALADKNVDYFKNLDDRLVDIEERHFGAKEVLNQNMEKALGNNSTNISNISKELGSSYATLAALQFAISTQRDNIKLSEEEVEQEAKNIHNYLNEVRKQKIEDSKQVLKSLSDKYTSDGIRDLTTQYYNGKTLDFSNINMSEEDKNLLTESLDTLHLDDKINSDLAKAIDVMLATHDEVKAAQDANKATKTRENSSTSQNEHIEAETPKTDISSQQEGKPLTTQESGQIKETTPKTTPQQAHPQAVASSGLTVTNIADGIHVTYMGDYTFVATENPNQFKVDFSNTATNAKHFNNYDLFTQEQGVDLTTDNYIVGKKPIINSNGDVIEKGTLVLNTEENVQQAELNNQEDIQEQQQVQQEKQSQQPVVPQAAQPTLASTGEVINPRIPVISEEQLAGPTEEKVAEPSPEVAQVPYDENDVISQANTAMFDELRAANAEGRDIDWAMFREGLTTKLEQTNTPSQVLNEQIERVINKGKELAARKGIKSVDAIMDVMSKSSRLRENTATDEDKKGFSDSVQKLLDVFNSEVGIDIIGNKKYVNLESLCRYCDKVLNDKLSAKLLLNNLIDLARKDKNIVITDDNVDRISENLKRQVKGYDISAQQLGIDYRRFLRRAKALPKEERNRFNNIIDNLQIGDNIEVVREDRGISFKVDGVTIGALPYPKPYPKINKDGKTNQENKDGRMYQENNDWNTDILILGNGLIDSKLKDLFVEWSTNIKDPDIKELNDIILAYAYSKTSEERKQLADRFENNKEVKKAVANGFTVDTPDYSELLEGVSQIWKYTRSDGFNYEGDVIETRAEDIENWFRNKVAPSFVFIQKLKENPNLEIEVDNISEGKRIETTRQEALPISKAIGTNYKGQVKLGICQEDGVVTLAGNGINGSTYISFPATNGNTFVVIPARNGNHGLVHAFPQKVSATNISNTAKEIKDAIYSEIIRICSDVSITPKERVVQLDELLRKILPIYTKGSSRADKSSSFFDASTEEKTNITVGTNYLKATGAPNGFTLSFRKNMEQNHYVNVWSDGSVHIGEDTFAIEELPRTIINAIEEHCVFNLSYAALNSELGYAERQHLTKRGPNGEYVISIPNQQDFTFNSYNDFILDNDLVLATTRPTEDGKSNFEKTSDDYRANQQLYVRLTNDTISPVEKIEEEPETPTTIANPRETEILSVLNSKKIKNKAEKLADLLFGKKVRKSLSFGKTQYNLFPKNIIFVDENLTDNAIVNPTDKSVIDNEHNGLIIPAKTVVLGKEWLEMATSDNIEERKQAAKKLIHEQLHILLSGENSKYIEQIREVFDEFAEKNTNEELNKYLYKWDEERYYTDGKLNQEGLEEFLVETLTSNELANALNNIETNSNENKNKKESLFQKIMKLLANILGIDIKEGSLYEKEFKLLRDIFTTPEQLEINFEEQTTETQTTQIEETTNEKTEETEDLSYEDEYDDLWDSSGAADLVDRRSRIQETTNNAYTPEMQSIKDKAIADGTFMKAPNGNPTNLTERQWLQVRTEAFKGWFGDWLKGLSVNQDNDSFYRGQFDEPYIDDDGDLILYSRKDSLYEKAGYKESKGVSVTRNLKSAIEYGEGQFETRANLVMDNSMDESEQNAVIDNGYYIIQFKDSVSNKEIKEAGESKLIGDITVPKGSYVIEHYVQGELIETIGNIDTANASKVVDENGEPLVVYHNSPNKFNTFKRENNSTGIYFTSDRNYANRFGNENYAVFLNIKNIRSMLTPFYNDKNGNKQFVVPKDNVNNRMRVERSSEDEDIYLSNHNYFGISALNVYKFFNNTTYWINSDGIIGNDVIDLDLNGEIIGPISSGVEFVVFNPNQIKSATDNIGTFSEVNDDIRYSRIRENTVPSIQSYVSTFPLSEQSEVIDKINNGEISTSCK